MSKSKLGLVASFVLALGACKTDRPPTDEHAGHSGTSPGTDPWAGSGATGAGAMTGTATGNTGTGAAPSTGAGNGTGAAPSTAAGRRATAKFESAPGVTVQGNATLEEQARGVKIVLTLEKAPVGQKAAHIHQKGDCSDIPGKSMGEHFAPHGETHGLPTDAQHHPGDLGNITVGGDGTARLEIVTTAGNLTPGDDMSFSGRAIVIHTSNDKGTPPSGDAGAPIACAVIVPTP